MKKLLQIFILTLCAIPSLYAQCVNPNNYVTNFTIANTSATAFTNKTVRVLINSTSFIGLGQLQANGSDIRFGSSCCTLFSHWIDSTTMNTAATQIWVRIPNIPAFSSYTLNMYHGATGLASTSNLAAVFPNRYLLTSGVDSLLGTQTFDWFEVRSGATVFVKQGSILTINAERVIIAGAINGNGKGNLGIKNTNCTAGIGIGAGTTTGIACANGGGAGYGGLGGCAPGGGASSCNSAGGIVYGTSNGTDIAMGSSGSTGAQALINNNGAGNGGGAVIIKGLHISISGTVSMNGDNGQASSISSSGGGGGSGGGIMVQGAYLNLAGATFSAAGGKAGNSYGACGGGGRIKIFRTISTLGTYTTSVVGSNQHSFSGTVIQSGAISAAGSVYTDTLSFGQLLPSLVSTNFSPCGLVYYSKSTGALNDTSTWGTSINGTGPNPSNFSGNGTYYYVNNNPSPTLTNNWVVSGTNSAVIFGDGTNSANVSIPVGITLNADTFYVNNNTTLTVLGNLVSNKPGFHLGSTVQYTLGSPQNILNGRYGNLIAANSIKTLLGNTTIAGTLFMLNSINCNSYTLTLGISAAQTGTLNRVAGQINGKLNRWFAAATNIGSTGLFPVGNGANYLPFTIEYTSAPSLGGTLMCEFISTALGNLGLPIYDFSIIPIVALNKISPSGFWQISAANGMSGGTYNCSATGANFHGIASLPELRLLRRQNATSAWTLPGSSLATTGTIGSPLVQRTGITALGGEFGIGSDSTINALPVTLIEFEAVKSNEDVLLNWSTAIEENNHFFEIEKLHENIWLKIGELAGNGNSSIIHNYQFIDKYAFSKSSENKLYYRLLSVDYSGLKHTSKIIAIDRLEELSNNSYLVYPNPFTNEINIRFKNANSEMSKLELFDITGKVIFNKTEIEKSANDAILLSKLQDLPKGVYYLKFTLNGSLKVEKIIKN